MKKIAHMTAAAAPPPQTAPAVEKKKKNGNRRRLLLLVGIIIIIVIVTTIQFYSVKPLVYLINSSTNIYDAVSDSIPDLLPTVILPVNGNSSSYVNSDITHINHVPHYLQVTSKSMNDSVTRQPRNPPTVAGTGVNEPTPYSDDPPDEPESNATATANVPTASPPTTNPKQSRTQAPTFVYNLPPGSNAPNLSISLPSSEWLEDIDTDTNVLGCGFSKCAFRSITGKHGYLVATLLPQDVASVNTAVDMAEYLAATYGIHHTVLARPITTDKRIKRSFSRETLPTNQLTYELLVSRLGRGGKGDFSRKDLKKLGRKVLKKLGRKKLKIRGTKRAQMMRQIKRSYQGEVVIMPIALYSTQNILVKCSGKQFRAAFEKAKKLQPKKDMDPKAFREKLRSDLNRTIKMMESPEAACLSKDFQMVIDTTTGGIIHIDIDRCFVSRKQTRDEQCQKRLHNLTNFIVDRVTYGDSRE